jgi:hypothetical protein
MLPGWGTAVVRAAVIVPVILLVLFAEVFGLLGLLCGRERRSYAMSLNRDSLNAAALLIHGPSRQPAGVGGQAHPDSASRELDVTIGQDVTAAAPRDVGSTPRSDHTDRARVRQEPGTAETRTARHGRRADHGLGPGARAGEQVNGGKTADQSATGQGNAKSAIRDNARESGPAAGCRSRGSPRSRSCP